MLRLTRSSYEVVRHLARLRKQSYTLTAEQIIQDYVILTTKKNV